VLPTRWSGSVIFVQVEEVDVAAVGILGGVSPYEPSVYVTDHRVAAPREQSVKCILATLQIHELVKIAVVGYHQEAVAALFHNAIKTLRVLADPRERDMTQRIVREHVIDGVVGDHGQREILNLVIRDIVDLPQVGLEGVVFR
jgi:hypothetical protein